MHLDEEQVQRLLHGEFTPPAETSVREHIAGCADCRERVAVAKREEDEVFALLRHVDHPLPRVSAGAVAARAGAFQLAWGRWAAGLLLALGLAGAAYAVPGSPLRAWVGAVAEWMRRGPHPSPPRPGAAPTPDPGVAGIAVAPGRELLILFASPQAEGEARVSLTDGAEVVVRAPIGAATFTADVDRLVINYAGPASFEIGIPRDAPRVEIRVGGRRVFIKDGPRVTTEASTDTRDPFVLRLAPAPR